MLAMPGGAQLCYGPLYLLKQKHATRVSLRSNTGLNTKK